MRTPRPGLARRASADGLDRLTRSTFPDIRVCSARWRPEGLKAAEIFETGNAVQYGHDAMGRLTPVAATGSECDTNGRFTQKAHLRTIGGSLIAASRHGYSTGQRSQVEVFDGASTVTEVDGTLQLAKPAQRRPCLCTAVGNRQQHTQTSSAGTVTSDYGYDANDRLTTETSTDARRAHHDLRLGRQWHAPLEDIYERRHPLRPGCREPARPNGVG